MLIDEIQNVPDLLAYIRTRVDRKPRAMGKWLFTGSQEAPLMRGVSESMAGRAAILQLLPFSLAETDRVSLLHGGYPEVLARPAGRALWFSSYIQTYLERNVRAVRNIRDLTTFRRFLAMLARRHGQILNKTDLAAPLGVSVPTIADWLQVLEITGQIMLVPPYFENFGKRLIKSPKIYLGDSGMACYLLGIATQAELDRSPFLGALFEGYVAAEILKSQANQGRRKELYHFRDQQGLEVDFLFPGPRRRSLDGGVESIQDRPAGHGGTHGVFAPVDGQAWSGAHDRSASGIHHGAAKPRGCAGGGGAGCAGICGRARGKEGPRRRRRFVRLEF